MLTGAARYVADIAVDGLAHVAFVRSQHAHARVVGIDTVAARSVPGVHAVYTAADLGLAPVPGFEWIPSGMARPPLAAGTVRFVGEPVAVVVADSVAAAFDGAEYVEVSYQPFDPVTAPTDAARGDIKLFTDTDDNVAFRSHVGRDRSSVLLGADVVVDGHFNHQRIAAAPLETNAITVIPHVDGSFTVYASSQGVHTVRDAIAKALGLTPHEVRVIAPHVGGGFGGKYHTCNEYLVVAAAARLAKRPVRWVETRTENLLGCSHGRGQEQHAADGLHTRRPDRRTDAPCCSAMAARIPGSAR